ncbi:MAG: pantoate--beta-alanine ligase [Bauldia sp.]|nr:pantoate--beta-alanine ligase [Bauldia sp.]
MASFEMIRTVAGMQAQAESWQRGGLRIALVPTMGALHAGHLRLVEEARRIGEKVLVSIFVNPAQFAPHEDFASYPRQEAADLEKLAPLGVDAVFAPSAEEMYPVGFATRVAVGGPSEGLETDFRPHFFGGVATVVTKLFTACRPHVAVFGEKDYQQFLVVRRLSADLGLGVAIHGVPTLREPDGLALSSRNAYLLANERRTAPRLQAEMRGAAEAIRAGKAIDGALAGAAVALADAGFRVDYLALRNAETLAPVADAAKEPLRLLAAAWLGRTRLIDNIAV